MEVKSINVGTIRKSDNYRTKIGDLGELMTSIQDNGLLQPVGVKKIATGGYKIVFGNRRLAAFKKLGKRTIPCTIIDDSKNETVLNLIENIQRCDVTLFEAGRAMHKLQKEGLTVSEICARLSMSKAFVKTSMDIFNTTPAKFRDKVVNMDNMQKSNKKGMIASTVASAINNTARRHNLTKKEINDFYSHASANETSSQETTVIVKLMGEGLKLGDALKSQNKVKCFRAGMVMRQDEYDRLVNKYGRDFVSVIMRKQAYDKIRPITKSSLKLKLRKAKKK